MKRRTFLALALASAARPVSARPPERRYRIAIITQASSADNVASPARAPLGWGSFFEEMGRRGYVEAKNLLVERYAASAGWGADAYVKLAYTIVATKPDIIMAIDMVVAHHLKVATTTIPILIYSYDPIAFGFVDNLARPGGNITGVSRDAGVESLPKYLEFLHLADPKASRIAFMTSPEGWQRPGANAIREAAQGIGITLVPAILAPPADETNLRDAFAQMDQQHVDGLIVAWTINIRSTIEWANAKRIPAIYTSGLAVARMGGLMSYNEDPRETMSHLASQIDMILKGANPGDIPIYQPAKFRLLINLATAKTIGIEIPSMLLAMATEVFE